MDLHHGSVMETVRTVGKVVRWVGKDVALIGPDNWTIDKVNPRCCRAFRLDWGGEMTTGLVKYTADDRTVMKQD